MHVFGSRAEYQSEILTQRLNMFTLEKIEAVSKSELYAALEKQVHHLLEGETDLIANAANFSALLYYSLPDLNWVGFYFYRNGELIVGPFQGKPACVHIQIGKGVCGTAAEKRATVLVKNVHEFPGHIACDSASNSEIVIPLMKHGEFIGVLDIDSPVLERFDEDDQKGLERLVHLFLEMTDYSTIL